jgi:transcriptional regulator with XRE-family HTH domain
MLNSTSDDEPPAGRPRDSGYALSPLPVVFWRSWEVTRAASAGTPGAVIALARQAHGLSQAELGALAGFSQSALSRLESGGNPGYDIRVLKSLGRLLGVPPRLLGLADEGGTPAAAAQMTAALPRTAVDRKSVLDACIAAIVGAPTARAWRLADDGLPADEQTVHSLLVVRRLVNDADNWIGAGNLAPAIAELYGLIDRMRRAAKGEMRRWLLDVTALYAEFYGWLCQEIGDLRGAAEWTERALQQAQAADDRDLVAYAYVRMAQLAECDHDDDRVIGLSRAALREPDIKMQVRGLALQQKARGHALARDESSCLRALDRVRELDLPDVPPWSDEYRVGYYFSAHHQSAQRASSLLDLGRVREAIASYERHRDSWEQLCRWEQAVHTARLARAYALVGEVEHAAAVGSQALGLGAGTASALVVTELRKLDAWRGVPAIASLTAELESAAPESAAVESAASGAETA